MESFSHQDAVLSLSEETRLGSYQDIFSILSLTKWLGGKTQELMIQQTASPNLPQQEISYESRANSDAVAAIKVDVSWGGDVGTESTTS